MAKEISTVSGLVDTVQELVDQVQGIRDGLEPPTPQQLSQQAAFAALAQLSGMLPSEDDVVFEGTKFIIPESTGTLKKAIRTLTERMQDEEEPTSFRKTYPYRPYDGAHAVMLAIREAFGFAMGKPIITFFGKNPPQIIDVAISPTNTVQVPWGHLAIPGLDDTKIMTGIAHDAELGTVFQLAVEGPKKYRHIINGFLKLVEKKLQTDSIYKGKAIDGAEHPNFIDTSTVDPSDVVYTQEVMHQLTANVWSPIVHADQLAALGQPGKRAVLFHGPYGTGKTLGALLTAQVAVAHGWTFLMCRAGKDDLMRTLQTARMYMPAAVFFEDVDTIAQPGNENVTATQILDTFDGLQTKGLKMLLVVTTNHVERLHRGMMRPGRLDAVIEIGAMDEQGVERLIKRVIGEQLDSKTDFHEVFVAMEGFMPAFVREAIDRAVRYSVARTGTLKTIGTEDLVLAAHGLRPQLKMMEEASDQARQVTVDDLVSKAVAKTMDGAITENPNVGESVVKVNKPAQGSTQLESTIK